MNQDRFIEFIKNDQIDSLLEELYEYSKRFNFDNLRDDIVILSGEFAEHNRYKNIDVIDINEARKRKNNIVRRCLEIIKQFEREISSNEDYLSLQFILPSKNFINRFEKNSKSRLKYTKLRVRYLKMSTGFVEDQIDDLVSKNTSNAIAILGDFGSGKSTFAKNFCYQKAKEWLEKKSHRLPLLIRLKYYIKDVGFVAWLLKDIKKEVSISLSEDQFYTMLNNDKLILILDGLDEMPKGLESNKEDIIEIQKLIGKGSPIIITCRPTLFENSFEKNITLDKFTILEMRGFDEDQIVECARNTFKFKATHKQWEVFIETIKKNNDIWAIASRPMFLGLLIDLYIESDIAEIKNTADLYKNFIEYTLARELVRSKMKKRINIHIRKKFIKSIAWMLFKNGVNSFTLHDIINNIKFDELNNDNIEELLSEGFFVLNKDDLFEFVHMSFSEYLVAEILVERLLSNNYEYFEKRVFYEEIFEFMANLFESKNLYAQISDIFLNNQISQIVRVNIIPPVRKIVNNAMIWPLVSAHLNDDSPLVRYVSGYTLPIYYDFFKKEFDERLIAAIQNKIDSGIEENTLVTERSIFLMNKIKDQFFIRKPNWDIDKNSIYSITSIDGTLNAYERIIKLGRENFYVIEESIYILTLYIEKVDKNYPFRASLINSLKEKYIDSNYNSIRQMAKESLSMIDV